MKLKNCLFLIPFKMMKLMFAVLIVVTLILPFNEAAGIHSKGICTAGAQDACNSMCETIHSCDESCVVSSWKKTGVNFINVLTCRFYLCTFSVAQLLFHLPLLGVNWHAKLIIFLHLTFTLYAQKKWHKPMAQN